MGREIKRVPLDFDWPLRKVWEGFLNPFYVKCVKCDGRGTGIENVRFDVLMRNLVLAAECSYQRPDDYFSPGFLLVGEINQSAYIMASLRGSGIEGYRKLIEESQLPCWPWPEHDPVDILLQAADLPPEWAGPVERNVIMRLARLEAPPVQYDYHHAKRVPDSHKVSIVPFKLDYHRGDDFTGIINYPHPNLGEMGIKDVGPKFYELALRLGCEGPLTNPDHFGWRSTYDMQRKIFKVLGMQPNEISESDNEYYNWNRCQACQGHGIHPEYRLAYETWTQTEPPTGEGWQVWETVTEGSPVTPVFANTEDLINHLVITNDYDREAATNFVTRCGWVPSATMIDGQMYANIDACQTHESP